MQCTSGSISIELTIYMASKQHCEGIRDIETRPDWAYITQELEYRWAQITATITIGRP